MKITIEITAEQANVIMSRYALAAKLSYMAGDVEPELVMLAAAIVKNFKSANMPTCAECGMPMALTPKGNCLVHKDARGERCYGSARPPRVNLVFYEPNI